MGLYYTNKFKKEETEKVILILVYYV